MRKDIEFLRKERGDHMRRDMTPRKCLKLKPLSHRPPYFRELNNLKSMILVTQSPLYKAEMLAIMSNMVIPIFSLCGTAYSLLCYGR